MKNQIIKVALTSIIAITSITAISQENKQAANARRDLKEAKTDSADDYNRFKKEAEITIKENDKKISELKAKKSDANKDIKAKYDKKVLALEQKNKSLKTKIEGSTKTKTEMWATFKREFNHDMEELGHAIRDIGVDNSK
jgi:hypothetical protein